MHLQWKITTVTPTNEKHANPRVTLQNVQALQRSLDAGGYVAKKVTHSFFFYFDSLYMNERLSDRTIAQEGKAHSNRPEDRLEADR